MLVQWEQVETVLRQQGHIEYVCHVCRERYEPCVAVAIVEVEDDVLHLFPPIFFAEGGMPYYVLTFCGRTLGYGMLHLLLGSKCIDDWRFWENILRRYPELLHLPLTERVLREVGCDIETEWALWQLAGNE